MTERTGALPNPDHQSPKQAAMLIEIILERAFRERGSGIKERESETERKRI